MAQVRLDRDEVDELPAVCMRCGQPSAVIRARMFSWCPPWVGILILVGLLPYIIVHLILTKRMRVNVPLCEPHKNHWLWRAVIVWGSLLVLGGLVAVGLALQQPLADQAGVAPDDLFGYLCLGSVALLVVWIVIAMVAQQTAIRPVEITDDTITLTGVNQDFRHALKELEADEDDDRPRRPRKPPHRPPPPDAYREAEE